MEKDVSEVREGELLVENVCWILEEKARQKAVLRACEDEREEAGGADLLIEKRCAEVDALFCGVDGGLKREFQDHREHEKKGNLIGFALAKGRSNRTDVWKKFFEMGKGGRVWSGRMGSK